MRWITIDCKLVLPLLIMIIAYSLLILTDTKSCELAIA